MCRYGVYAYGEMHNYMYVMVGTRMKNQKIIVASREFVIMSFLTKQIVVVAPNADVHKTSIVS